MDAFSFAMRHGLFEGYDYGNQRVIEDDVRAALDCSTLQEALDELDLAGIKVTDDMKRELSEYFGGE